MPYRQYTSTPGAGRPASRSRDWSHVPAFLKVQVCKEALHVTACGLMLGVEMNTWSSGHVCLAGNIQGDVVVVAALLSA